MLARECDWNQIDEMFRHVVGSDLRNHPHAHLFGECLNQGLFFDIPFANQYIGESQTALFGGLHGFVELLLFDNSMT